MHPELHAGNPRDWATEARARLARRRTAKPATKAGQIRALWPEIEVALAMGQSMKSICAWLEDDAGVTLAVTSLTSYISRIRRRESRIQHAHESQRHETQAVNRPVVTGDQGVRTQTENVLPLQSPPSADPIAQAMHALTKPRFDIRKLHCDGDPTGKSLI